MEISKNITIDGKIVELYGTMKEMSIYKEVLEGQKDKDAILYFVRNNKKKEDIVIGKISIYTDCGQNEGYISTLDIKDI